MRNKRPGLMGSPEDALPAHHLMSVMVSVVGHTWLQTLDRGRERLQLGSDENRSSLSINRVHCLPPQVGLNVPSFDGLFFPGQPDAFHGHHEIQGTYPRRWGSLYVHEW